MRLADRATFASVSGSVLLSLTLAYVAGGLHLSAQSAAAVTFTRDIAPIVFAHCSACHRPGGGAPFDLITYDDVRQRAARVRMSRQPRRSASRG
jgi:mono/diheme cytochrome c family protein